MIQISSTLNQLMIKMKTFLSTCDNGLLEFKDPINLCTFVQSEPRGNIGSFCDAAPISLISSPYFQNLGNFIRNLIIYIMSKIGNDECRLVC